MVLIGIAFYTADKNDLIDADTKYKIQDQDLRTDRIDRSGDWKRLHFSQMERSFSTYDVSSFVLHIIMTAEEKTNVKNHIRLVIIVYFQIVFC